MNDVIRYLGLTYKQFYDTSLTTGGTELSLAATLISVGEYPDVSDMGVVLKMPVKNLTGDIYRISSEKALRRYLYTNPLIIARGDIPADSMVAVATATGYAKTKNVPILLTRPDELPDETLTAVKKLNPKKIIVVGGPVAVSTEIELELKDIATVERIWGPTRYETAVELAKTTENPMRIVIMEGQNPTADGVITAAGFKAPLIYVKPEEVPQSVKDYLSKHKTARIVFGSGVSDAVKSEIRGLME
jgi:hypothetical protein